jgi:sporulation protein YabP
MDISDTKQTLTVKDRGEVTVDNVRNVVGFDESYVTLETEMGKITVEGGGMRIESLTRDDGKIEIKGRIDGVYYSTDKVRHGLFKRML